MFGNDQKNKSGKTMPVKDTIQSRRGSSAQWSAANPILADGEIGYDSTTKQMKVGDGVTAWNSLAYSDISATNLTTGTLPDARLSAKVKSLADLATPASTQLLAMNSSGVVVTTNSQFEEVIMITAFGESTTGGKAPNSEAPTWQLAARSSLNFFNVNTSVFEALDVGTNNNLDHQDLNSTTHGPELELANACERGEFTKPIYYVQTGQGSSTVAQWDVGNASGYWTKFLNRTNAAKTLLAVKKVQHVVWLQIGQNDVGSTNQYTFKGALRGIISRIKTQLPGAKIIIATIPGNAAGKANYNARINELDDDPDVIVIDGDLTVFDTYHYDYNVNRRIANRYIAAMRSALSLRNRPITLVAGTSSTLDEVEVLFNAQNAHAHISETFDLTFDRDIVQFQLSGIGMLLALDADVNEDNWVSGAAYYIAGFVSGSLIYWSLGNMGTVSGNVATTTNAVYRFRKSGGDLHFEQRGDNGTWSTVHTATGLISSVYSARVRITATSGAGTARAWTGPY